METRSENPPPSILQDEAPAVVDWGRPWSHWILGTLIVWFAILVVRRDVLTSPPYWDYGIGLWPEALAIIDEDFNLWRHTFVEKHWVFGGSSAYRLAVTPWFIAFLYEALPSPIAVFATYRSLVFLAAAYIAVGVYFRLRPRVGAGLSLLTSAALTTSPLYGVQYEMLSMETFLATGSVVCALLMSRNQFGWACLAAAGAFLVKASGFFLALAIMGQTLIFCAAAVYLRDWPLMRRCLWGFGGAAATFIVGWGATRFIDGEAVASSTTLHLRALLFPLFWCPELMVMLAASALGLTLVVGRSILGSNRSFGSALESGLRRLIDPNGDGPAVLFCAEVSAGLYLINGIAMIALARYLVMAIPLLYMGYALLWLTPGRRRWIGAPLLMGVLAFNLADWDGKFLPSGREMAAFDVGVEDSTMSDREGAFLERSREYLTDHRSNIAAMLALEAAWKGEPVFVGAPFNHFAAMPELGYLSRPVAGYVTAGYTLQMRKIEPLTADVVLDPPNEATFVYSENPFYQNMARFEIPPPEEGDEIIYHDRQPSPLIIYRKKFGRSEAEQRRKREWYWARIGPVPAFIAYTQPVVRAMFRARALELIGLPELAAKERNSAPGDPAIEENVRQIMRILYRQ